VRNQAEIAAARQLTPGVPELSRMFFFEKKNQKTFIRCRGLSTSARPETKVFCFFFSKKKAFLLPQI
jgi:hypothetical protein